MALPGVELRGLRKNVRVRLYAVQTSVMVRVVIQSCSTIVILVI
jgi:hypothetical protein